MSDLVRLKEARRLGQTGEGRRIRERAGISLDELAPEIPCNKATLARWETGESRPRTVAALRWLATLELLAAEDAS